MRPQNIELSQRLFGQFTLNTFWAYGWLVNQEFALENVPTTYTNDTRT